MNIYLATVDEFSTWQLEGSDQWEKRRRLILVEADDIHGAFREAQRVGEANATMGPRFLGVEVIKAHRVNLPGELRCVHAEDSPA